MRVAYAKVLSPMNTLEARASGVMLQHGMLQSIFLRFEGRQIAPIDHMSPYAH